MTARVRIGVALALAVGGLGALRGLEPDPRLRRDAALLVLLPLGYAHQLAAWGTRKRRRGAGRESRGLEGVATGGVACGGLLVLALGLGRPGLAAPVLLTLAGIAVWHVLENEREMARAATRGRVRLAPLPRTPRDLAGPVVGSALLLFGASLVPEIAAPLLELGAPACIAVWTAEECIAAVLLFHVISFALFRLLPPRRCAVPRATERWRIARVHALAVGAALVCRNAWPELYALASSPSLYLVSSLVHAADTVRRRRA